MIITGKSQEIVIRCRKILNEFLAKRGLELNSNKTLITHIRDGFDFLGFNIRRLDWNPKYNNKTDQETILIIKPSRKGIIKLMDSVRKMITIHRPIKRIISDINPVLRG